MIELTKESRLVLGVKIGCVLMPADEKWEKKNTS